MGNNPFLLVLTLLPVRHPLGKCCTCWHLRQLCELVWLFHHWLTQQCWVVCFACMLNQGLCLQALQIFLLELVRSCGLRVRERVSPRSTLTLTNPVLTGAVITCVVTTGALIRNSHIADSHSATVHKRNLSDRYDPRIHSENRHLSIYPSENSYSCWQS